MDAFESSNLIERRVDEFKAELPTIDEIQAFYSLEKVTLPSDRPYSWSNTITSLDGVVSIGQGNMGVKLVGLKTFPKAKSRTDFRLLAAGWAYSDVIVFSGASCRAEPEQQLLLPIPDLIKFRREVLKKASDQPDVAIVTASGWLDVQHPVWQTKRRKLVATSKQGFANIMTRLQAHFSSISSTTEQNGNATSPVSKWLETNQIEVVAFESPYSGTDIDFVAFSKYLKSHMNASYCDVSAGPTLISLMIKAKILDEYRYTTSGLVAGKVPTGDEGIEKPDERPDNFPASINDYPLHKSPVLEFVGVRVAGPFHVYHRGRWVYRH